MDIRLVINSEEGRATITLRRGEKGERGNAFTPEMLTELQSVIAQLRNYHGLRVVFLEASGKDFCTGRDIEAYDLAREEETQRRAYQTLIGLSRLHVLKIALVHGRASGFGAALMLVCDLRFMQTDALVSFPEGRYNFPSLAAVLLLADLPKARAMEMLLNPSRSYSAGGCMEMGLINDIYEDVRWFQDRLRPWWSDVTPEYINTILSLKARLCSGGLEPFVEAERLCVTRYLGEPGVLKKVRIAIEDKAATLAQRRMRRRA